MQQAAQLNFFSTTVVIWFLQKGQVMGTGLTFMGCIGKKGWPWFTIIPPCNKGWGWATITLGPYKGWTAGWYTTCGCGWSIGCCTGTAWPVKGWAFAFTFSFIFAFMFSFIFGFTEGIGLSIKSDWGFGYGLICGGGIFWVFSLRIGWYSFGLGCIFLFVYFM